LPPSLTPTAHADAALHACSAVEDLDLSAAMTTSNNSVVEVLASWAATLSSAAMPGAVRRLARTCFVDAVGVAIGGSTTKVAGIARAVGEESAGRGSSSVFGVQGRFAAPSAAFMNGTAAHALDFDDNCYAGFVHGSAVIAPAALAVAQQVDASGSDLITAFVAGSECEYAFGAATGNALYDQGWWTTGVLGPIGATVAASHLLELSAEKMACALGLAIASAGGMKACFGTDAKALMAGRASEAGVVCALMAARGAVGPLDAVESRNGFTRLFNGGMFDVDVLDALGKTWFLQTPGVDIKRIPVCLSSHAAVDALMELVLANGIRESDIDSIICDVPPIVCANLVYADPATPQQAQFSMQYAVATSLRYGSFSLTHLDAQLIGRGELGELMARIRMHSGPMWSDAKLRTSAPEGANVTLILRNGTSFTAFRGSPRGSSAHPLSQQELDHKFVSCVSPHLGAAAAGRLAGRLCELDTTAPVRDLFRTTSSD
jgi:2-methylcitrate dehydratase PrpD